MKEITVETEFGEGGSIEGQKVNWNYWIFKIEIYLFILYIPPSLLPSISQ